MFGSHRILLSLGALAIVISIPTRIGFAQGFKEIHTCTVADEGPHGLVLNPDDGFLYGMTQLGGPGPGTGFGTVVKVDPSTGNVTTIHTFAGPPEGEFPNCELFYNHADGFLYGTTPEGGTDEGGTLFKIDTSGGNFSSVSQAFASGCNPKGSTPNASLFKADDDNLYIPMTNCGNPDEEGVILEVDPTLSETRLGAFVSTAGTGTIVYPAGHLVQGSDGNLYGTAPVGAPLSGLYGGVYRIEPTAGSAPVIVHGFTGTDGIDPLSPLCLASDGYFYGTTNNITNAEGTALQVGTIYRVDVNGNFQQMHVFDVADGGQPQSGLMQASDGDLYGVAGAAGYGGESAVIYRMDLSGQFKVVLRFGIPPVDDQIPQDVLVQGADGKLYGVLSNNPGRGAIYSLDLTQTITDLVPSSGPASGGTPVTIVGTGFVSGATVTIEGGPPLNATFPDASHIDVTTTAGDAGTLADVLVHQPDGTAIFSYGGYFYDFGDVPAGDIFEPYVRSLVANGVTAGCGGGSYCRNAPVLRKQMAVFALKAKNGFSYSPPPAVGVFTDVPASDPFAPWIEELYNLGVVGGCGAGPIYCPDSPVLRQQMPVFLLKTLEGSGYTPPPCTGMFADVACPGLFAPWIEDVVNRGIAAGCGGGDFCPMNPTTRGQMAPFLVKTFGLP